jgi:pyruvate/2-oxoglutarate/acetoin dehydrogenase E1 component
MGIPGLKIAAPATSADARLLLKAAIRDENPVVFFEHKRLYSIKGAVDGGEPEPLGRAKVVREGTDVTLVSAMTGVHDSLHAAEELAGAGSTTRGGSPLPTRRSRTARRSKTRTCPEQSA